MSSGLYSMPLQIITDNVTRSYDLVVGTFDVFWDLFQVLFSGFISGSEGWELRKERKALTKSLPFGTKGTNTKRERERKINPINKSDLFVLL